MMHDTQNLWKIEHLDNGGWKLTYFRGNEAFDCGSPTRADTPLSLVLEFIEHNADVYDVVSVCGALYQLGSIPARA